VFDSGVGGLSIVKCITEQLPHENIIYIADNLHAPYGEKSVEFIIKRVNYIAQQLIAKGVKAIVIACNTATVNAIEQLRAQVDIPIIGVEPAIKPAAKQSISKKVAILATKATSENQRFKDLIDLHHNGAEVLIQPCPGLVEFIEQGKQNSDDCNALLKQYIDPLIAQGIDTLVLGCTHYPFVQKQISIIAGPQVKIIETAVPVTVQLTKKLVERKINACETQQGEYQFFSSLETKQQEQVFSQLWQDPLTLHALEP
jgi:glutamate racemase